MLQQKNFYKEFDEKCGQETICKSFLVFKESYVKRNLRRCALLFLLKSLLNVGQNIA